jgi:hypothetical protein
MQNPSLEWFVNQDIDLNTVRVQYDSLLVALRLLQLLQ